MGLFSKLAKAVVGGGIGFLTGGPAGAVAGAAGGLMGGGGGGKAIKNAAQAQVAAAQMGINENARQFDLTRQDQMPWLSGGQAALGDMLDLLGVSTPQTSITDWAAYVNGNPDALANWNAVRGTSSDAFGGDIAKFGEYHYGADGSRRDLTPFTQTFGGQADQAGAIETLKNSPLFKTLFDTGQETILQNAAATGGLRGGNIQRSLADFGSDTLTAVIEQQLSRLGGISGAGLGAAQSIGGFGANMAANNSNLFQQQGAAQAGGILGKQAIKNAGSNNLLSSIGQLASAPGANDFLKKTFGSIF